jgi:DNA polymerase sigma
MALYPSTILQKSTLKPSLIGFVSSRLDDERSDIDVSIISDIPHLQVLNDIANAIDSLESPIISLKRVLTARIPLITINDSFSGLQLDLVNLHPNMT